MLIALLFVILIFFIGGLCMYILAKFVENNRENKEKQRKRNSENKTDSLNS